MILFWFFIDTISRRMDIKTSCKPVSDLKPVAWCQRRQGKCAMFFTHVLSDATDNC